MTFLHLTQWDLSKVSLDSIYSTPADLSNYWKGKLKLDQAQALIGKATAQLVEAAGALGPCGPILQDIFAKQKEPLIHGKYAGELLKEYIFEEVRAVEFPSAPSRKRCMFLFDGNLDYKAYASGMGFNLENYGVLEIEILDEPPRLLRAELSLLNCNLNEHSKVAQLARSYWLGTQAPSPDAEILYEGRYRIARIVTPRIV